MTRSRSLEEAIASVDAALTPAQLIAATRDLVRCQHLDAVPKLLEVIGYNNPALAGIAVQGLVDLGAQATPLILEQLDPTNYGARAWAVRALAEIGDVQALETLIHALGEDIGPSVRRAAAKGLGTMTLASEPDTAATQQHQCVQALARGVNDGEWVVRYAVAVSLERRLRNRGVSKSLYVLGESALVTLTDESHEDVKVVRLRARLALQRLGAG